VVDHTLDERANGGKQLVRLVNREVTLRHARMIEAAVSAGQRVREPRLQHAPLRVQVARGPVPDLFVWSRALIWFAALFAFFTLDPHRNPLARFYDDPDLTRDLGSFTDVWARWDSVWFLRIAEHGYHAASPSGAAWAFYPLYPGVLFVAGHIFFGHYVLGGIIASLVFALGAFLLLHRVAEARLGAGGARRAVLYLAVFPMTFFLQAVYSESLYLLLVLGAFVLAERGRWLPAWVVTGLALLTRPSGLALLPPLALLAWRSRDRLRALAGGFLPLAMFAVYPLALWARGDDPWAFGHAQALWHRHLSDEGPFGGIWNGVGAAWAGVEQLASGSHVHRYWPAVHDMDPVRVAAINLQDFGFLILFVVLTVIVWRRFGAVYGLFAVCSLALPLSTPSSQWPLQSLPRFGLAIFPFFLALASLGGRPRVNTAIVGVSSVLLGVAVTEWALWQWVA
jgi:hypothetical protein